jgi:hypothetical protein
VLGVYIHPSAAFLIIASPAVTRVCLKLPCALSSRLEEGEIIFGAGSTKKILDAAWCKKGNGGAGTMAPFSHQIAPLHTIF